MNVWNVIYRFTWVVLGGMILVALGFMFWPLIQEDRGLRQREAMLRDEIRAGEERVRALQSKQERFQNDPAFVERIAHDIGLAKPNETIFRFVDEDSSRPPIPPAAP